MMETSSHLFPPFMVDDLCVCYARAVLCADGYAGLFCAMQSWQPPCDAGRAAPFSKSDAVVHIKALHLELSVTFLCLGGESIGNALAFSTPPSCIILQQRYLAKELGHEVMQRSFAVASN